MTLRYPARPMATETDRLILIVTGAHLRAEIGDRPLAYGLRDRMLDWVRGASERDGVSGADAASRIVVCSDLWYLNRDELRARPTVSIGGPGVNALSAHLGDTLPSAFAVEGVLVVQLDLDADGRLACCWGVDHRTTAAAVDAFAERYLDDFMTAATRDWPEWS